MAGSQRRAAVLIGWQKWWLAYVILLLSQWNGNMCYFFPFDAEMTPVNPVVREGDTLVANCTIKDSYSGSSNASDLFFKLGSNVIPMDQVTVLNSRTAQVTLPNMTRNSLSALYCWMNKSGECPSGKCPKMQEGLHIQVGVPPIKPILTQNDCIVYNWETMNCTWHPKDQSWKNITNLFTKATLSWTVLIEGPDTKFYACPHQSMRDEYTQHKGNTCQWKRVDEGDSFRPNMNYYMKVNAENDLGTASSNIVIVNSRLIVRPDPVKNLEAVNHTSKSFTLIWKHPAEWSYPVVYKLHYKCQWNNQDTMIETADVAYTLNNLIPNTDYTIQVRVKPVEGGYWSDVKYLTTSTLPDVPKRNPAVVPGGLVIDSCGTGCQNITIFWQEIPRMEWHSNELQYQVNINQFCQSFHRHQPPGLVIVQSGQHSVTVQADAHCRQTFTVQAVNERGTSPEHSPTVLVVDSLASMPSSPSDIIAIALNNTAVSMRWDGQANSETETLTFWCRGSHLDKKCQGPLHWQSVPAQQTTAIVMLTENTDYRNYLFGVAQINKGTTSGIHWSDCVFDDRYRSPPPRGNVTAYDEPGSLLVHWNAHQDCQRQRGYIINYLIYYCPVCDKKCCPDSERSVITPRTASHHIIHDLKHRQQYLVRIKSVTAKGSSLEFSDKLYSTTYGHWFHGHAAVWSLIGIVIGSALVLAGLVTIFMKACKMYSWFENLPIKPPEGGLEPTDSTSSELTLSGKDYCNYSPTTDGPVVTVPYKTQESMESTADSGRGSISEQNLLRTRPESSISEESELDEVFIQSNDMKTQNGYLKVTMLDKVTMSDNGYLKPIPAEAVKENGYLQPAGCQAFRTCDHPQANCPALSNVHGGSYVSNVPSNNEKSEDIRTVENPGYRVVDIVLDKEKSSVA